MVRLLLSAALAFPQPVRAAADVEPTFRHETLKKLLDDLKDKDVMVRRQAAITLGMPDGSEGKGGPRPRGDLWPAMLGLMNAQEDKDMQVRANAMKSLGLLMRYRGVVEKMDERFEKVSLAAIAALKDPEDLVKTAAAGALPLIGIESKKCLEALGDTLKHEDAKVRAAAADGAKGVRPIEGIVPALADRVSDKDSAVRLAAVNTLIAARVQAVGALKPLIAALRDENERVANGAAVALGGIGLNAASAVPALVDAAYDPKSPIRPAAVSAIGTIQSQHDIAVPTLIAALNRDETRANAFYALGILGTTAKDAVPAIMAVSRDAKGAIRPDALYVLSIMDPNGASFFELLFGMLQDPNPNLRNIALNYFGRGQSYPEALPLLVTLFKSDPSMRNRIAYAFGAMGAEAKPAVPMLVEMIGDQETNQHLRRVLINAVNAIDPTVLKPPGM
jgi:HEAT repeat protein